ncbi:MAG: hypothetical protein QOJ59_5392 [Thermomicrobiales bacterium]|jgi:hypothetical protein|nr:hypothetical protein [Thermomicrobiales bacterium]
MSREAAARARLVRDVGETVMRLRAAGVALDIDALGRLSGFLKERVAALQSLDDSPWVEALADARGEIETIYATALFEDRSGLSPAERAAVDVVLCQILEWLPSEPVGR